MPDAEYIKFSISLLELMTISIISMISVITLGERTWTLCKILQCCDKEMQHKAVIRKCDN